MSNRQDVMNKTEIVDKKNKGSSTNYNKKPNRSYQNKRRQHKNERRNHYKDQKQIHSQTADQIKKVEAQLKAVMIELEDLRNRSMRSTLVFKNIIEERNETWEDTCHILSNFITTKLDLSYTKEFIDSIISKAHRGVEKEEGNTDQQQ